MVSLEALSNSNHLISHADSPVKKAQRHYSHSSPKDRSRSLCAYAVAADDVLGSQSDCGRAAAAAAAADVVKSQDRGMAAGMAAGIVVGLDVVGAAVAVHTGHHQDSTLDAQRVADTLAAPLRGQPSGSSGHGDEYDFRSLPRNLDRRMGWCGWDQEVAATLWQFCGR